MVLELVLVAISVGLDNFGGATALGMRGVDRYLRLRVAVVFGVFEAGMPVLGLALGHAVARSLGDHADLIAGLALCAVGIASLVEDRLVGERRDATSWRRLVVLGAALSVDNLVVGFALGSRHVNLLVAALVIGVVSVGLSLLGLELGERVGRRVGDRAELLGGLVLVAVGVAVAAGVL